MRLKNKLLSWIFSLFFIPLLIFFVFSVSGIYNRYKNNYSDIKEENLTRLQENYYGKISRIESSAERFIESIKNDNSTETVNEKINFLKTLNREYEHVFYIDSYNNIEITDNTDSNELRKLISESKSENFEFFISNPYLDKASNKYMITFVKKIKINNFEEKILGITILQDSLPKTAGGRADSRYYLIKESGEILATNSPLSGNSFYSFYHIQNNNILDEVEGSFTARSNGQNIEFMYKKLEMDKLYVIMEDSKLSFYKNLYSDIFLSLILCMIVSILAFTVIFFFFYKSVLSLIYKIRQGLNRVISLDKESELIGEYDEPEDIKRKFENFSDKIHNKVRITDENISGILEKTYELNKNQALNYKVLGEEQSKMLQIKEEVRKIIGLSETNSEELEKLIKECEHIVKENKNITLMTESLRRSFHKLSDSSVNIEEMIDNINMISDRTNLLSLNARKEAERVSEYGESYQVIAEEIRNLSVLILDISNKAREISHNVIERIAKSNQVMDLTITKINKLQDEIKRIDKNIKFLYENVNLENIEENELNKTFSELEQMVAGTKEKLTNNINLINDLNTLFREIEKINNSLEKRG
ncbi:methyl-accepting chemotaxis protein [Sebaldella sp. S0638]|uniref:methyl-accepting chemotaxis protein n=1 Tax=Sebaldella sp. S0638 TaxID=2957809 RepID=UPI0020A17926|nr:methyl-accepting chemotaxis protein [Sebaldella sp. S0638]MCP1223089.1 methyl-accepting chemotaxis protein [Sebaldella sp. S0638]